VDVATWNINSIRAREERLWAWVEANRPDVLCLQETKVVDDGFPVAAAEARGYRVVMCGQKAYNGVAILARAELTDCARGFADGDDDEQARLIAATVAGVRVLSVYVPNGQAPGTPTYEFKLRWLQRLRAYLERSARPDQPVVVCGDFNVARHDRDVHDVAAWRGKILFTEPEKAALERVLDWGLVDGLRLHDDRDGQFSWWDYRAGMFQKNRGLRIDYVFMTRVLAECSRAARIDREARQGTQPSDHAPVVQSIDWPAATG
jgi:exodeoxyribonuclease III